MVIVYDLETKEIVSTEDNTLIPQIPVGDTETKVNILKEDGRGFISVPYELGSSVNDYKLIFNENDEFIGLEAKS
ncbi:hypothetical protein [Alkalihalophilus marmarensis]|uniref:hypothetical protein n=1 Tax=Alkalihalophilus marmarensis TaxID=521377 RepID=UPI002E248BE4|nr:hypothetical protein [Alkalihalophilus marmarensis]